MGVSLTGIGGGGGGGGLHFREPPDSFIAASLAAARTARDTAFVSGGTLASVLDEYAGDPSLAIILGVTGATDRTFETYTGSPGDTYDSALWVERSDAVQGNKGDKGDQARFDIKCYDNGATAPSTPTGGSFVISTGVLTAPTGTTVDPVEPPTGQVTWVSRAPINPGTQSGTVTPTWSAFVTDVEASLAVRAEAAETAAEAAQTAAETAQTAAENSRD